MTQITFKKGNDTVKVEYSNEASRMEFVQMFQGAGYQEQKDDQANGAAQPNA